MEQSTFNPIQTAIQLAMKKGELKGKQEMLDKLSPAVNHAINVIDNNNRMHESLKEHMKSQNESNTESFRVYEEAMAKREKKGKEFCQGKTADELKEYLAGQYIPYNSWKGADYDTLVKLVMEVYEEEL